MKPNQLLAIPDTPDRLLQPHVQQLYRLMIEWKMVSHEFVATIFDSMVKDMEPAHVRYLGGSIIIAGNRWGKDIGSLLIPALYIDRYDAIIEEYNQGTVGEFATPCEIVAALHLASHDAPLNSTYSEIIVYAFKQCCDKFGWADQSLALKTAFDSYNPHFDIHTNDEYRWLRRTIRKKAMETGKQKGLGNRKQRKETFNEFSLENVKIPKSSKSNKPDVKPDSQLKQEGQLKFF